MQASTSQVESYAGFSISHPVPDFKAVRSLKIPNYEFLNKPRPRLQRCERVWEGPCNYECSMNGCLLWSWELHIFDLARYWCWSHLLKIILHIESNFRGHFRFGNIPKTIFNHFVNWVHERTARPLGGLDEAFEGSVVQCTTVRCGASQTLHNKGSSKKLFFF